MSVLLVGISHRSAPVALLEKVAVTEPDRPKLLDALLRCPTVAEAMVVATCNRVEVYAVVDAFHQGLADVGQVLADHAGTGADELTPHLYVRYSEAAVEHLFTVASGLDSMVVGEQQVLGQIRAAYAASDAGHGAGRTVHELAQHGLRVGKRVHSETGIDRVGASVVSVALDRAAAALATPGAPGSTGLAGRTAAVLGAGAMGGLAVAHLLRAGATEITVLNRTPERAARLAETAAQGGAHARAAGLDELPAVLADADVLVSCTGAVGSVLTIADAHTALAARPADRGPVVLCDLGLPRDVEPAVASLPGVVLVDLASLQRDPATTAAASDTAAARTIVADELAAYLAAQRSAEVTPTVTALRQRAAEVVDTELLRLDSRLPGLVGAERDEVARTVRRVVDKLLHAPTVRVKQLAAAPGGDTYAAALRELFELGPGAANAVAAPRTTGPDGAAT